MPLSRPHSRDAAIVAAYLAAYVLLDALSYVHPILPLGITPWNPPPALSMFLLLSAGLCYWPALYVAAIAADVVVRGAPSQPLVLLLSAGTITAGYALAAALLVRRLRVRALDSARDLGLFLAVVVPAALLVAIGYVGANTLLGRVPAEPFLYLVLEFWIGDLNGILVFTPALLVLLRRGGQRHPLPALSWSEIALQAAAVAAVLWLLFATGAPERFPFNYPLFLPLIWIAARWGLPGATLALVGMQLGLITALQLGGYPSATFVQLQLLMLTLCVVGLVIGAIVTQRLQVEARLRDRQVALGHALRFAAAGEMSSAMAHELNQPMAALSSYLGACQLLLQEPERNRALLNDTLAKAMAEAQRASEVVRVLRDFFRAGRVRRQGVNLSRLVEEVLAPLRGRCEAAGVRISVQAAPELSPVQADALQIETALHNLLSNAIEALDDANVKQRSIDIMLAPREGGVEIAIQDSGPGIAADVAVRLFEPFNTSKEDGMGLGLAISRSLVEAHGGELFADAWRGGGARFVMRLPAGVRGAP